MVHSLRWQASNGGPLLIFFSCPHIHEVATMHTYDKNTGNIIATQTMRSPITDIMADPMMRPGPAGSAYFYEMWRLSGKDATGTALPALVNLTDRTTNACGSILIGRDQHGAPVVHWDRQQWEQCTWSQGQPRWLDVEAAPAGRGP